MSDIKQPTLGNGKICYLEIPTTDVSVSSSFYQQVLDWQIRKRGDGNIASTMVWVR